MKKWNSPALHVLKVSETKSGSNQFHTPDKSFIGPDGNAYTSYAS